LTKYLLDTNTLSQSVRYPRGEVANRIRQLGSALVYTSVIVAAEMRFGVARRGSRRLLAQVEAVLEAIRIAPFAPPLDAVYGRVRWALEQAGKPVGANDLLIACHALHDGSVLVTDNVREFSRVPGLGVENWLK
jgi:tRNA(fMet)-specific endonuclease VapC